MARVRPCTIENYFLFKHLTRRSSSLSPSLASLQTLELSEESQDKTPHQRQYDAEVPAGSEWMDDIWQTSPKRVYSLQTHIYIHTPKVKISQVYLP